MKLTKKQIRQKLNKKLDQCQSDVDLVQALYNKAVFMTMRYKNDLTKAIFRRDQIQEAINLFEDAVTPISFPFKPK